MSGWVTFSNDAGDAEWEMVEGGGGGAVLGGEGAQSASRGEALSRLAAITGLSVAASDQLLERAGGDVQRAVELHLDSAEPTRGQTAAPLSPPGTHASAEPAAQASARRDGDDSRNGSLPSGSWLSLLKKQEEQLDDILRRVEESGAPFRDPLFPAGPQALGLGCTGLAEVVDWRRPVEIWEGGEPMLFKGELAPSDVIQVVRAGFFLLIAHASQHNHVLLLGTLSAPLRAPQVHVFVCHSLAGLQNHPQGRLKDCWLLGSFAIAAAKPHLLQSLVRFSWVEKGLHAIKFFVEGDWITVVVDDLIPVDAAGRPVFGRCRQPHHIWVQIFEKAYAKLCGSFKAVEYGSEDEGLVHLTGGFPKIVELHKEEELLLDGRMWQRLLKYFDKGHLMGCANHGSAATTGHIEPDHAYSLLGIYEVPCRGFCGFCGFHGLCELCGLFLSFSLSLFFFLSL